MLGGRGTTHLANLPSGARLDALLHDTKRASTAFSVASQFEFYSEKFTSEKSMMSVPGLRWRGRTHTSDTVCRGKWPSLTLLENTILVFCSSFFDVLYALRKALVQILHLRKNHRNARSTTRKASFVEKTHTHVPCTSGLLLVRFGRKQRLQVRVSKQTRKEPDKIQRKTEQCKFLEIDESISSESQATAQA